MCKIDIKNGDTRIDPCMRTFIMQLENALDEGYKILACCCGHGKYPMTLVYEHIGTGVIGEMFSGRVIPRKKRFYKRDKQGYYYIPELNSKK